MPTSPSSIRSPLAWLEKFCRQRSGDLNFELTDSDPAKVWNQCADILGVSDWQLAESIGSEFGLETAPLPAELDPAMFEYIPKSVAIQYGIFPVRLTSTELVLAVSNPFDQDMLSVVTFVSALHIEQQLAPPALISKWIDELYPKDFSVKDADNRRPGVFLHQSPDRVESSDSAVVALVSDMFVEAFDLNASDIHIEPFKDGGVIRYRVDGLLRLVTELPLEVFKPVIQRIKAISGLNLANRFVPQDGSVRLQLREQPLDLRISTVPVKGLEKAVIRLLPKKSIASIEDIGLTETELAKFRELLGHTNGIFVMTGPTGSGKSTTLYSGLAHLNTHERCLVTVEDPVERDIDGVAQISVNPDQGVTFGAALRSILRQDPDIVLVGEIRDEETAEITLRAAITGHFVMTTLHTSDAITTIYRLVGLGVELPVLADALKGVAAQRLVRRLCPACASEQWGSDRTQAERYRSLFPDALIKVPVGCAQCEHTGYSGRLPIIEIIAVDPVMADAIRSGENAESLRQIAWQQGNRTISEVAREVLAQGKTSVEEVARVLGQQFWLDCERAAGSDAGM